MYNVKSSDTYALLFGKTIGNRPFFMSWSLSCDHLCCS